MLKIILASQTSFGATNRVILSSNFVITHHCGNQYFDFAVLLRCNWFHRANEKIHSNNAIMETQ